MTTSSSTACSKQEMTPSDLERPVLICEVATGWAVFCPVGHRMIESGVRKHKTDGEYDDNDELIIYEEPWIQYQCEGHGSTAAGFDPSTSDRAYGEIIVGLSSDGENVFDRRNA